jgi:small subunit ribosomal protein S16
MSLVIRMSRQGRTNRSHFRVGVFDSRTRRDGPPIEPLGHYDPLVKDREAAFHVNAERVAYWFSKGASVSDTVRSFLKRKGIAVPRKPTTRERLAKEGGRRRGPAAKARAKAAAKGGKA